MPDPFEWAATLYLAGVLGWICLTDLKTYRIPDTANLALVAGGLLWHAFAAEHLLGALLGYAVFAALGEGYFRLRGEEGLGLGDAKLLAGAGAWVGPYALPVLVAIAATSALLYAVVMRQRRLAFGPWIALAFWLSWTLRTFA